jgi:site-specific DNA-methyltransferase (adenine-specific)
MQHLTEPYYSSGGQKIYLGDCLEIMKEFPDKSFDLVLTDPPYGTTSCSWDTVVPFEDMWKELLRVAKDDAALIFTASQPFTSALVMSNPKMFRHEWIYQKRCASNFAQTKYSPMKEHESVLVFGKQKVRYFPEMEKRKGTGSERVKSKFSDATRHKSGEFVGAMNGEYGDTAGVLRYPSSVQEFNNRAKGDRGEHPTQKPVKLMEYLIKTYSTDGDTILDPFLGSGTTLVAARLLGRRAVGIDISEKYCKIAVDRLRQDVLPL